jgi:hypothetical protein
MPIDASSNPHKPMLEAIAAEKLAAKKHRFGEASSGASSS